MLWAERPRFEFRQGQETGFGAHTVFCVMPTWGEAVEREVYHSPPSSAEVKNEWSYTSAPSVYLGGMEIDNFTVLTLTRFKLTAKFDSLCTHLHVKNLMWFRSLPYFYRENNKYPSNATLVY